MNTGVILGVLGLLVALVALPLTYVWGRRSRQKPELRHVVDFDVLMSADEDIARAPLQITYGDQEINRVSRTYVALWNHRGDTVRRTDIVDSDRLRVHLQDDDVALQAGVISASRKQCAVDVALDEEDRQSIYLTFDFLDEGDGFIVEIIHQGSTAGEVAGTVRGAAVVDKGTGDLTGSALDAVQQGWRRRVWSRLGRRRLVPLVATAVVALGLSVAVILIDKPWREPSLVSPAAYKLTTLDGQREFAQQVRERGSTGPLTWVLLFYPLLVGAPIGALLATVGRRVVPVSVLRERYHADDEPPAQAEFAPASSVPISQGETAAPATRTTSRQASHGRKA